MPNGRDEWMNDFRQQRAEQMRRRYQPRIRRKPLDGGVDRDRSRTITQEQLEHAHDSNAYDLAMYDANQDAPVPGNRAPSPYVPTPGGNPIFNKEKAIEHNERTRQERESARNGQSASGGSQTADTLPDIDEIKLRYATEAGGITIHPVDIEAQVAAQYNELLKEVLQICRYEGVPPILRNHREIFLGLCADYGIDEENDAEARAFLDDFSIGDAYQQHKDDPLNAVWQETLTAYEKFKADKENKDKDAEATFRSKLEAYKALVENTYGVEFTHVEGRTSWNLLGIIMAHVAFEDMAKALSIAVRDYFGFHWDDATAFRRTIGKITIHNSIEPAPKYEEGPLKGKPKAIAIVDGKHIKVFWNETLGRNFYLIPNVALHELGHILNANGAFGANQFNAWFNLLKNRPGSREGMGNPDANVLIGKTVIYSYQSEMILPTLAQDIGIWDPDHVIFDELRDDFGTQIQSLQQSTEETPNEITADAIVNWVKHLITAGRFGFTSEDEGLNWLRIMGANMDEQIRNAIGHNALKDERNLPFLVSQGMLPEILGQGTIAAGTNVRSNPSIDQRPVGTTSVETEVQIFGYKEVQGWIEPWIAVWYKGRIRWVYGGQMDIKWDDKRPISEDDASLNLSEFSMSLEDDWWIQQLVWS